ncbi:MAG: VOC family protein [Acidimicrobiia bacterium]|nr:VOC family protein [Acidimicrobiia bacterium]
MTLLDAEQLLPRAQNPLVKAVDIAHLRFSRPDLQRAADFYADFGLHDMRRSDDKLLLYADGGTQPCVIVTRSERPGFDGLGLMVESDADLDKLAGLPGASDVEAAEGAEGVQQVRLTGPLGFEVRAVSCTLGQPAIVRDALDMNLADHRDRINETQRPPLRASSILRLGHCAMNVLEFEAAARWFIDTFGLIPSDIQVLSDNKPFLSFLRCDRGDTPTDHHTVVLVQSVENSFSHAAFEVIDLDDVAMGQQFLMSQGHKHAWGIGRHVLGSQIFDYWRDPWGDKVEHFCDSDLFTADHPTEVSPFSMASLYQWGPSVPRDFEAPKPTPRFIRQAVENVRNSDEMTFDRTFRLLKAVSQKSRSWGR